MNVKEKANEGTADWVALDGWWRRDRGREGPYYAAINRVVDATTRVTRVPPAPFAFQS